MRSKALSTILALVALGLSSCGCSGGGESSSSTSSKEPVISSSSQASSEASKESSASSSLGKSSASSSSSRSSSSSSSSSSIHTHRAKEDWDYDEGKHWHKCTGCSEKLDEGEHIFPEDPTEGELIEQIDETNFKYYITCSTCDYGKTITVHVPKEDVDSWISLGEEGHAHPYLAPDEGHGEVSAHYFVESYLDGKGHVIETCYCGYSVTKDVPKVSSGFKYRLRGNKAVVTGLEKELTAVSQIDIPATLDGHEVIAIGENAFADLGYPVTFNLPEGLQEIGDYAFSNTQVNGDFVIPDSVLTLGEEIFPSQPLKKVVFGKNIVEIAHRFELTADTVVFKTEHQEKYKMFFYCKEFIVPEGVTYLQSAVYVNGPIAFGNSFAPCPKYSLPSTLTHVGPWFYINSSDEDLTIDEETTFAYLPTVDNPYAFAYKIMGSSYDEVGRKVHDGCVSLHAIFFGALQSKRVDPLNLELPNSLVDVTFERNNIDTFFRERNPFATEGSNAIKLFCTLKDNGYYWGPESNPYLVLVAYDNWSMDLPLQKTCRFVAPRIGDFQGKTDYVCSGRLSFPEDSELFYVGYSAFSNFRYYEQDIKLPSKLIYIGEQGFYTPSSVKASQTLTFGDALRVIPDDCFGTESPVFASVKLPKNIALIGDNAFSLEQTEGKFTLPNSLLRVGISQWNTTEGLVLNEDLRQFDIGEIKGPIEYNHGLAGYLAIEKTHKHEHGIKAIELVIDGNPITDELVIPDTVKYLGKGAIAGMKIKSLTIPASCYLNDESIFECYYIEEVHYAGTAAQWAEPFAGEMGNPFPTGYKLYLGSDDELLTELVLDENFYDEIGSAFLNIGSLQKVTILEEWGTRVFDKWVPNVTKSRFAGCENLTEAIITTGVTKIPNYFFQGLTSLKTCNFPSTLTYIGRYAFYGCSNLAVPVEFSAEQKVEIADHAFEESGITSFALYKGSIDGYAFSEATSLGNVYLGEGVSKVSFNAFENPGEKLVLVMVKDAAEYDSSAFPESVPLLDQSLGLGRELNDLIDAYYYYGGEGDHKYAYLAHCELSSKKKSLTLDTVTFDDVEYPIKGILPSAFDANKCSGLAKLVLGENIEFLYPNCLDGLHSLEHLQIGAYATSSTESPRLAYLFGTEPFNLEEGQCYKVADHYIPSSLNRVTYDANSVPERYFNSCESLLCFDYLLSEDIEVGQSAFVGTNIRFIGLLSSGINLAQDPDVDDFEGLFAKSPTVTGPTKIEMHTNEDGLVYMIEEGAATIYRCTQAPSTLTIDCVSLDGKVYDCAKIAAGAFDTGLHYGTVILGDGVVTLAKGSFSNAHIDTLHFQSEDLDTIEDGALDSTGLILICVVVDSSCTPTHLPTSVNYGDCIEVVDNTSTQWAAKLFDHGEMLPFIVDGNKGETSYMVYPGKGWAYRDEPGEPVTLYAYPSAEECPVLVIPDAIEKLGLLADGGVGKGKYTGIVLPANFNDTFYGSDFTYLYRMEENGIIYYGSEQAPYAIVHGTNDKFEGGNVVLPDGVIYIYDYAFINCGISSITLPATLRVIGEHAFSSNNLTAVTIPNNVATIYSYAFKSNLELSEVNIESLDTDINSNAWYLTPYGGYGG